MFTLPELDYGYDAFGEYISKDIMELHHSKHHQAYIDKLNAALDSAPDLKDKSLEELLKGVHELPENVSTAIRNQGGGHYNHTLFWKFMSPNGGGEPTGKLNDDISEKNDRIQKLVDEKT